MKNILFLALCILSFCSLSYSQTITQTVKGKITDAISGEVLPGASIVLNDSSPINGTIADYDGTFILENIPIGRQHFEISMLGYESYLATEILITSGKEVVLNIALQSKSINLNEVVIEAKRDKDKAINSMASLSSRQFTVEETQRYAGGLSDPARLVSSFAGVATPSISSNGISVRGNSPTSLLWRIEGVEIPSPNHFADLTIPGAGLLTVLSSQVLGNSDFYTGAFPAEYGNGISGVFDMNLRNGNSSTREHTIQAGLLGIDFASEGPIKKGNDASYLLNYRYSTLALISPLLPDDAGILKYQDLCFKINMPTKNAGTFSLWSINAYDAIDTYALDREEWESAVDRENSQTSLYMFATGLNHKMALKSKAFLKSSLAFSGNGLTHKEQWLDDGLHPHPFSDAKKNNYKVTLQSSLTSYLSDIHTNRTGFYISHLRYNLDLNQAASPELGLSSLINENGQTNLFQFYSQSKFVLTPKLVLNTGFHYMYFQLNDKFSIEPRIALNYQLNKNNQLGLAYGLHSQIESLPIYFVRNPESNQNNKGLDLMKSNQIVLSYNTKLTDNLKLTIEPYYQHLNNVPVSPSGHVSTLNNQDNLFFNEILLSTGKGRNIGIDFTLESYLSKGLYYLISSSIFDSKYKGNDGIERNTRFNKNYVMNALIGKEWKVGKDKNNLLGVNLRVNYLGGNRVETIDVYKSINNQEIVYGETNGELSFSKRHKDTPIYSCTISYRKNKSKYSSVWTLQILNITQTEEFETDIYNLKTNSIEQKYGRIMVPNLSYKIEF